MALTTADPALSVTVTARPVAVAELDGTVVAEMTPVPVANDIPAGNVPAVSAYVQGVFAQVPVGCRLKLVAPTVVVALL